MEISWNKNTTTFDQGQSIWQKLNKSSKIREDFTVIPTICGGETEHCAVLLPSFSIILIFPNLIMTRFVDPSYNYSGKCEKFQLQYFASTFKFLLRMVADPSLSFKG